MGGRVTCLLAEGHFRAAEVLILVILFIKQLSAEPLAD